MDTEALRATQAPLKEQVPGGGLKARSSRCTPTPNWTASASFAKVETGRAVVEAGLHPATGGDGTLRLLG